MPLTKAKLFCILSHLCIVGDQVTRPPPQLIIASYIYDILRIDSR